MPRPCLPAFALPLLVATMGHSACPGSGALLQHYGYTQIRPPSSLFQAGTMVSITSSDPFEARVICDAEGSLGPHAEVMRSKTASSRLSKLNGTSYGMEASAWESLKQTSRFSSVASVEMTMQNVSIVELNDEDVIAGMRHRSPGCRAALRARIAHGYPVTMISSALVSDVHISVQFDQSEVQDVSHTERAGVLKDLAVKLGGEVHSSDAGSIVATGLVYGIRDDAYLSALSISEMDETQVAPGTRYLTAVGAIAAPEADQPAKQADLF